MRITRLYLIALLFGLLQVRSQGAWTDITAGLPWIEEQNGRQLGFDRPTQWFVAEDPLGRLFVGGTALSVFDGQAWTTYAAADSLVVRSIQFGTEGKGWVAAMNELGYFTEPSIGHFKYHSLLNHLPESERLVGDIWGVGLVDSHVYFMGREKLYGWDGRAFQIWSFPGTSRLFPLRLDGETWFQHRETGLYRLTSTGPKLEIEAAQLPESALFGLVRDNNGLLLVGHEGFLRPGSPPHNLFGSEVSRLMSESRVTSYARLEDGSHLVGTVNGGLIIISADGRVLRQIDSRAHPTVGAIMHTSVDSRGYAWCATTEGIFRLDPSGAVTLHTARTGLEGGSSALDARDGRVFTINQTGAYRLVADESHPSRFVREMKIREVYTDILLTESGALLARHGGIDFFDGTDVQTIYDLLAKGVYRIEPSYLQPGNYLLSEGNALVELRSLAAGGFASRRIGPIPDFGFWLAEDARGHVWVGTASHGVFMADAANGQTTHVKDPSTGQPLTGYVCLSGHGHNLLVMAAGRVLQVDPDDAKLNTLLTLPPIAPRVATPLPGSNGALLLFTHQGSPETAEGRQGLGRVTVGDDGQAEWQELDVPALHAIGLVQNLKFTVENGRPILWVSGGEALLRLNYEAIPILQAPPTPFIRLDTAASSANIKSDGWDFPFAGHQLSFRIFTGDPSRAKDWRVQIRLGQNGGTWLAPTGRRNYEFSNLSEGTYRFEARTINAAGLASEPAIFTFRILPPWYRSNAVYAGYALVLVLGAWGTIRFRERRILALNERLERQIQERTVELVKANAAKDEFLAGVSHEIRNPMNGVIGIADSLPTAGLDPESRRKFGLLRECADHLSSLLEDLLDLSKMQVGVIELNPQPFDLPALVETVAAMAAGDSGNYRIPVETAISPGVPRHLVGDARRIRQILLNFVSNALKFSGRGKVEVTVWCQPAGAEDRVEVIFAVADEGPGITPEEQVRLFQRFERGAAARGGRVPGTGLGLALCKGYAQKMGGRIWLESEPGRGSCFYFSAPLGLAPEPVSTADGTEALALTAPDAHPALVVDDQEYNRIVLVDLLARLGIRAEATADGTEALALAGRHAFGLIFLDYDLPGLSGLEVSRGIRALPGGSARARIFATTAFNTPEKQRQCLEAGMDFFLGKPVTLERLRKALAQAGLAAGPVPPSSPPPPTDRLANLRQLAAKKRVPFGEQLALYLSELQVELEELLAAVGRQQSGEAARSAHRLCGRCSFIYERELEQVMRQLEEAATRGKWPEAAHLAADLPALAADLRLRLASAGPAAPPA